MDAFLLLTLGRTVQPSGLKTECLASLGHHLATILPPQVSTMEPADLLFVTEFPALSCTVVGGEVTVMLLHDVFVSQIFSQKYVVGETSVSPRLASPQHAFTEKTG